MEGFDSGTKTVVQKIPLLTVRAGPREGEAWKMRLKEEYQVESCRPTSFLAVRSRNPSQKSS